VQAATHAAHAVLAAQGQWPSNEKTLLTRAGVASIDGIFNSTGPAPEALARTVQATQSLCAAALAAARTA
jgi:cob(I)alamin adenosyltransferase